MPDCTCSAVECDDKTQTFGVFSDSHEKNRQTENQVHPFPYKTEQAGLTIDLLITKSKYETEFSTQMFMKLWVPLRRLP